MAFAKTSNDFNAEASSVTRARNIAAEFRTMARDLVSIPHDQIERLDLPGASFTGAPRLGGNRSGAYPVAVRTAEGKFDFFGVAKPRLDRAYMIGLAERATIESLIEKVVSDTADAAGFTSIVPSILFEKDDTLHLLTPLCAWPVGPLTGLDEKKVKQLFFRHPRAWAELAAIDALFMNFDRHEGNVLAFRDAQGRERILGIDQGVGADRPLDHQFDVLAAQLADWPQHRHFLKAAKAKLHRLGADGIARLVDRLPDAYAAPDFKDALKAYMEAALATLDARLARRLEGKKVTLAPQEASLHENLQRAKEYAADALCRRRAGLPPLAPKPRAANTRFYVDEGLHVTPSASLK